MQSGSLGRMEEPLKKKSYGGQMKIEEKTIMEEDGSRAWIASCYRVARDDTVG